MIKYDYLTVCFSIAYHTNMSSKNKRDMYSSFHAHRKIKCTLLCRGTFSHRRNMSIASTEKVHSN